jgi:hypothetical protein
MFCVFVGRLKAKRYVSAVRVSIELGLRLLAMLLARVTGIDWPPPRKQKKMQAGNK